MELKQLSNKLLSAVTKYRYALIVLIIGLVFLLLPGKKTESKPNTPAQSNPNTIELDALSNILKSIDGAGDVKVLLSIASGEETIYQTDSDISTSGDGGSTRIETVLINDSQRQQAGLVRQVNPPIYLGAIVVCQGADNAAVRLAITPAIAKITGLGTDHICVLKMK